MTLKRDEFGNLVPGRDLDRLADRIGGALAGTAPGFLDAFEGARDLTEGARPFAIAKPGTAERIKGEAMNGLTKSELQTLRKIREQAAADIPRAKTLARHWLEAARSKSRRTLRSAALRTVKGIYS